MIVKMEDPGSALPLPHDSPEKMQALSTAGPFFLLLAAAWGYYFTHKDKFPQNSVAYIALVGISFSITSVSMNMLNKACVSFTHAPSSVTIIQMIIASIFFMLVHYHEIINANRRQMMKWCVVPIVYAAMLNTSLLGYEYLSLTLVTILRNCSPLLTIVIEQFTMPPEHRPRVTVPIVASLLTTILGAFMYSYGLSSFSFFGLCIVILNALLAILDRIMQRRLLVEECKDLPLPACMVIQNSLGMIPTFAVACASKELAVIRANATDWTDPGIILMLVMSGFMGLGIGIFGLMCQKAMSATSFQVLQNSSKVVVIVIAVRMFGEALQSRVQILGLLFSLLGSAAYGYIRSRETPAANRGEAQPLNKDVGQKA